MPQRDFSWFSKPEDGGDAVDARALAEAINCLDAISFRHRTDAFRLLAARYREDLERMKAEDERCASSSPGGGTSA